MGDEPGDVAVLYSRVARACSRPRSCEFRPPGRQVAGTAPLSTVGRTMGRLL